MIVLGRSRNFAAIHIGNLHNLSTLAISLHSMTPLPMKEEAAMQKQ